MVNACGDAPRGRQLAPRRPRRSNAGSAASLPLVRHIRSRGEALFQHHGRWISKHQIRTLLLCSLVITSLFYPAVGIYFWASKGGPGVSRGDAKSVWASLSTPFMDSFASSGRKHVSRLSDLRMIWDDARDLRAVDVGDASAWLDQQSRHDASSKAVAHSASRPRCQSISVEHVFVTTDDIMAGRGPRFGVLEKRILNSALQLQRSLESELRDTMDGDADRQAVACVKARPSFPRRSTAAIHSTTMGDGDACLTLSPLEYWDLDPDTILADEEPAQRVSQATRNRTRLGVPLSASTTLAGRWHLFKRLPRAEYLAFTFFLQQDAQTGACSEQRTASAATSATAQLSSRVRWHEMLTRITGGQVRLVASPENILHTLVLQFAPDTPSSRRRPTHILLLTAYAFVIIYISRGLIKLRKVHSRFGLAFTGTTQLIISMIMSVSICALLGIRLTLVPWELLPFVIVVVGSENMFSLTKAIIDTPLSLTVSSRIAHGLGKVGVPITLTTLADILLLLVIAFSIGVRAVREFCVFAIFSLMMDWFLQMTFFVTVLSIDMQRLELADLLTQGTRLNGREGSTSQGNDTNMTGSTDSQDAVEGDSTSDAMRQQQSIARKEVRSTNIVVAALSTIWKARSARTASLTLILVYMSGLYLYYGTGFPSHQQSSFVLPADWDTVRSSPASETTFDPFGHLESRPSPPAPWWTLSPSADLWTSLNPLGAQELRLDVQPWTILSLRSSSEGQMPPSKATFAGWALFRPRIRAVIWFAKLVVLPISGTTALLWMLLLYLLKDTELLDAQRDKSEADPSESSIDSVLANGAADLKSQASVLANVHSCDIELLFQDRDLVASIDNSGGIRMWRISDGDRRLKGNIRRPTAGLGGDQGVVSAGVMSAEAGWLAVGYTSGRVHFVSTETLETIWDQLPDHSTSPIISLATQPHESMHPLDAAMAVSAHRDGTTRIWNVARKQASLASSQTQLDSRLRWRGVSIAASRHAGNSGIASSICEQTLLGFTTTDGQFHIRAVEAAASTVKTVFTLNTEDRSQVCSAMLSQMVGRTPPADEAPDLRRTLLLGFANGRVRLIDFETAEPVSSVELEDGPVTALFGIDSGDATTSAFVAQTASRASLLIVSGGAGVAAALAERSGSVHGSLSAYMAGSPLRIRTPNGSRTNAANFWADGSTPPSPASELGNPLSYPMSSHGSASRLRRASAHMRDRSGTSVVADSSSQAAAVSSSLAAFPNGPPPTIATQKADERQLRLLGWIRCERGGSFAVGATPLLIGVSRAQQSWSRSRWEWWSLDLRHELVLGRGGELLVCRQPLQLMPSDRAARETPSRSSMQLHRNVTRPMPEAAMDVALSFSRLHPVRGIATATTQRNDLALLFGFGGSIASLRVEASPP